MQLLSILPLQLLELTRQLQAQTVSGVLEQVDHLQQQRAKLISDIDLCISESSSLTDLDDCRLILIEVSSLEAQIAQQLEETRLQLLKSVREIKSSKLAIHSYDQCR